MINSTKQKFNRNIDFSNGVSRSTRVITLVNKDLKHQGPSTPQRQTYLIVNKKIMT